MRNRENVLTVEVVPTLAGRSVAADRRPKRVPRGETILGVGSLAMKFNCLLQLSLGIAACAMAIPASAVPVVNLVYDATIHESAQGFGTAPRALSLQATGQFAYESGCVSVTGAGAIAFGS